MSTTINVQSIGTTRINLSKKAKVFEDDVFITIELSNETILLAAKEIKAAVHYGCLNPFESLQKEISQ